jgi:1-acyl-sn-glycerol-3-phosphate acyltransferase
MGPLFVTPRPEDIGTRVPRRGNAFTRWLARCYLKLGGWKLIGVVTDAPRFIIIGAPHTSNWDFMIVMATAIALNVRVSWMGKHTLFEGFGGRFLRWLGGIPVDRNAPQGIVGENVKAFRESDGLVLCITPEGTRGDSTEWKTGFHRIAREADVPILLAAFDYQHRVVWLGPTIEASSDLDADMAMIRSHYAGIRGRHPKS